MRVWSPSLFRFGSGFRFHFLGFWVCALLFTVREEALGMTSDGQRLLEKKLSLPDHTIEKMTNCFARVFEEMDVDNSGSISFIEFADYFQRRAVQLNAKGVINNDGKLKKGERFRLARIFFDGEDIAEDKTLGESCRR